MWRFLLIFVVSVPVFALDEDWRVRRLDERYQDFFSRLRVEEEYAQKRQAGAAEVTKERQAWDRQMNTARLQYIREKKAPPDMGPAYREWALEQQKYREEVERARHQYVEIENRIQLLERSAKHIPENLEYDLQPW